jgi:hypothetical protein
MYFVDPFNTPPSPALKQTPNRFLSTPEGLDDVRPDANSPNPQSSRPNRLAVFAAWYICLLTLLTVSVIFA